METNLILFRTASLALIVALGPDVIYVVTRSMAQGRRIALVSALGVSCGLISSYTVCGGRALHTTCAVRSGLLRGQVCGGGFLIYVGIKTLLNKKNFIVSEEVAPAKLRIVFFQGVASNVLNSKAAMISLAFLLQFMSPQVSSAALQLVFFGSTFAMLGLVCFYTIAYFSGTADKRLRRCLSLADGLRWLTVGVLVIGLGLRFALPNRR